MKQVDVKDLKEYSARFGVQLVLSEAGVAEKKYSGLPLNIESSTSGIIVSGEGFEQKFLNEEISSAFDTGKSLILTTEAGQIYTFTEAGESKGIKIIKAANAPKDAASRADQRKKALAQGYSGVRYETEEGYELEEDGKGIKVLPASSAPKDPEDRKKKRQQWLDQGYDGVRWEGEERGEGQDLVDNENLDESRVVGPAEPWNGELRGGSAAAAMKNLLYGTDISIRPLITPGSSDHYLKIYNSHNQSIIIQVLGFDGN
jgi:hypothetical protein